MAVRSVRSIHLMWSQACDLVERADRLHQQFFQLGRAGQVPVWEPPADVFETGAEWLIRVAVPDADPADFEVSLTETGLRVAGRRRLPREATQGVIRQLEMPYGRLERHIPLPAGRYRVEATRYRDGCLEIRLERTNRDE